MMDLRTIKTIEFGAVSAVRVSLNRDVSSELSARYIAFDTETTGLDPVQNRQQIRIGRSRNVTYRYRRMI